MKITGKKSRTSKNYRSESYISMSCFNVRIIMLSIFVSTMFEFLVNNMFIKNKINIFRDNCEPPTTESFTDVTVVSLKEFRCIRISLNVVRSTQICNEIL